jgi:hypothetical protein
MMGNGFACKVTVLIAFFLQSEKELIVVLKIQ